MRVLKIIHTMGHGGAENVFRWLAWQLKHKGIDVVAGIPLYNPQLNRENWITPALEELGIPYETFDKSGNSLDLLSSMKSLIKKIQPDIVHSHLLDSNFYSSIASKWLSVPHVCTEHGDISLNHSLSSKVKFACVSIFSNSIICVSEAVRNRASKMAVSSGKFEVIYNGFIFNDEKTTFRQEIGIPDNAILIGNVGNLYPVKGQRYLVQAFARFLETYPNSYLVLVGRGNQRQNLEDFSHQLRIPHNRLIFTGFRKDIANIMKSLDVYVQPSLSEGLPVSLLEAMSAGIPAIATAVGGVPEIIGENRYGLLVSPGSWQEIYRGIIKVVENIGGFKENAKSSKEFVKDNFSVEKMACKYIELYRRILRG